MLPQEGYRFLSAWKTKNSSSTLCLCLSSLRSETRGWTIRTHDNTYCCCSATTTQAPPFFALRWVLLLLCDGYNMQSCKPPIAIPRRRNTRQGSVPSKHSRIDVLVVLEGPTDDTTSLTFRDIAETVQDGLHGLGHPSRAIYCTNIALDNCLDEGGKVIVLAAHNLASFLTADGDSAVLKWKLLPPDAGKYSGWVYIQERSRCVSHRLQKYSSHTSLSSMFGFHTKNTGG